MIARTHREKSVGYFVARCKGYIGSGNENASKMDAAWMAVHPNANWRNSSLGINLVLWKEDTILVSPNRLNKIIHSSIVRTVNQFIFRQISSLLSIGFWLQRINWNHRLIANSNLWKMIISQKSKYEMCVFVHSYFSR